MGRSALCSAPYTTTEGRATYRLDSFEPLAHFTNSFQILPEIFLHSTPVKEMDGVFPI